MCISVANNRLFVGSIPKSKTKEQIVEEFAKVTGKKITFSVFLDCVHIMCFVMPCCGSDVFTNYSAAPRGPQ